ncbi:hypothetical protein GE061_004226 [Apolygus lucorum]|uniref:Uncharacterized protein n=1 Tax=Apolygus lucorum TaxID=248454 RepID=A0A6A4IX38_APOLU|nr:hypothetical protein GE061_004226 [Apolygus lucorum]
MSWAGRRGPPAPPWPRLRTIRRSPTPQTPSVHSRHRVRFDVSSNFYSQKYDNSSIELGGAVEIRKSAQNRTVYQAKFYEQDHSQINH